MFRAKFIFVFSSLVSIRLCIYAIYNISSLVFFNSFNDGWHEQEWIWIEIQMSVAGWAWNSDLGQSHISVDWTVGAVGGICGSFGVEGFLWELLRFWFHSSPTSSQGYTWSSLHKWRNTVVSTVYIRFVCFFVVHKDHKCIQGTWKWKHMIYGHFLSEFERLNNDSFVNFTKQNCKSSFVNLSFKTIFWETGFVNLRCKSSDLDLGGIWQGGVVLIIGKSAFV